MKYTELVFKRLVPVTLKTIYLVMEIHIYANRLPSQE